MSSFTTANEEEDEQQSKWDYERLMRGVGALMIPILVSAGLGAYLAHLQGKKPPQAWFWGKSESEKEKEDPNAPVVMKKNELKGRCKAV